jgi:hypothetical protein
MKIYLYSRSTIRVPDRIRLTLCPFGVASAFTAGFRRR